MLAPIGAAMQPPDPGCVCLRRAARCCIAAMRLAALTMRQSSHNLGATYRKGRGSMRSRKHKGNIFVGNLPADFSDERLAETFDPFGIVLSAAIARDPNTG